MKVNEQELIIGGITLMSFLVIFIIIFISLYQKRFYLHQKEKQVLQSFYTQEILKTQLEIQEQTFKNISQEIHDNIGQTLSFIKLIIMTINVENPVATKDQLLESKNHLTKVIQDLRDLSKTLNTDFIEKIGLLSAVEQQLTILKKTGHHIVNFVVTGTPEKYPSQKELVIYRVIQELLHNIVRHSAALEINIKILYKSEGLTLKVIDNGVGFDQTNIKQQNNNVAGLGLKNVVNRMALIRGSISIHSQLSKGTEIIIELPKGEEL